MTHVDVAGSTRLRQITVAAIARAAGRGLFTAAEAEVLIDRIRAQATTTSSSIQDSHPIGAGERPRGHAPVDRVLGGQTDIAARVIWILEKLGWASDVRWTNPERLARLTRDMTVKGNELPGRRETS